MGTVLERLPATVPASRLAAAFDDGQWTALVLTPTPLSAPLVADDWDADFDGWRSLAAGEVAVPEPALRLALGDWVADHVEQLAGLEGSGRAAVVSEVTNFRRCHEWSGGRWCRDQAIARALTS